MIHEFLKRQFRGCGQLFRNQDEFGLPEKVVNVIFTSLLKNPHHRPVLLKEAENGLVFFQQRFVPAQNFLRQVFPFSYLLGISVCGEYRLHEHLNNKCHSCLFIVQKLALLLGHLDVVLVEGDIFLKGQVHEFLEDRRSDFRA